MSVSSTKHIAVIDGNSLLHRAFHAVPPYMTTTKGEHTNAVFGFIQMLTKLIDRFSPWGLIVCFDKGKPTARLKLLPTYKEGRPPMDESLHEQFPLIKELLSALAIPVVELEGWEGDDLLGTLGKQGQAQGYDMLLVTGDKDMYQLTDEHIKIVSTKKGITDVAIMNPDAVKELYGGITPALVPDFYGLKGDPSDNIAGVPGIGPKKAAQLIGEYGSLESVLEHAADIKGKMGENIRKHAADALVAKEVATIICNAPVEIDFEAAQFPSFDMAVAKEAFVRLDFTRIATRFFHAAGMVETKDIAALEGTEQDRESPQQQPEQLRLEEPLMGVQAQALFNEVIEAQLPCGLAYKSTQDAASLLDCEEELWMYCEKGSACIKGEGAQMQLVQLLEQASFAAVDVKQLIHKVYPYDSALPTTLHIKKMKPSRLFDSGVAAYLLDSSVENYTPQMLAENYLNQTFVEKTDNAAIDSSSFLFQSQAYIAYATREVLHEQLEKTGALACFEEIEMPLVLILAEMERTGMQATAQIFHEQARTLTKELHSLENAIYTEAGEQFNIASPEQLSHILFDVLMLPTGGLKRTKRGFISTNAKVLEALSHQYQVVANVLEYREKSKILKTYLEALPQTIQTDGRIHTTFNQTVTTTGRLSSSNPNLQNIPIRSELGRAVRKAFTVPQDSYFVACDYSQIELRLLAHFSGDGHLIEAFKSGRDFHAQTAARVFGIAEKDVTKELRSRAKAVNFGIVYGQQSYGLSQVLSISTKEAQAMIDSYYEAYPAVRTFLDSTVAQAQRLGYAQTLFGRRRLLPEFLSGNVMQRAMAAREAMNHPMQGTAADIIKIAMQRVQQRLHDGNFESLLIMQIHDELDLQVPKEELEAVCAMVKKEMETVIDLAVPLVADVSWGTNWAEAK